jgi:hypothetical protein
MGGECGQDSGLMSGTQNTNHNKYLSDQEEVTLQVSLDLLQETLEAFPAKTFDSQCGIDDWMKFEDWARLAMNTTYKVFNQLGPIQTRAPETSAAFLSALSAFERTTDIVERQYQQLKQEDFSAAKSALQSCIAHGNRLL